MTREDLNNLASRVFDAAFAVHTLLGPGLLESAYKACLQHELSLRDLRCEQEVPVPVVYKGKKLGEVGYRIDLLVEGELIVEIKALEAIAPVHHAQLLSYLKMADKRLGLLINFNVASLRDGISRRANKL